MAGKSLQKLGYNYPYNSGVYGYVELHIDLQLELNSKGISIGINYNDGARDTAGDGGAEKERLVGWLVVWLPFLAFSH